MKRTEQQRFGKKFLLSVIVATGLTVFTANAQTGYLGFTAGAQYSTISSNFQNWNGGIGYNAGASFELRLSQKFGIEAMAGIGTLNASSSWKDSIKYYDYMERLDNNYTFNSSFIQTHLLFKYYILLGGAPITPYDRPTGSGNYLYFFAGPYMGIVNSINRTGTQTMKKHINYTTPWDSSALTSNRTFTGSGVQEDSDRNVIFTQPDLGISLGAGLSLRLNSNASLDFTLRYTRGLLTFDNPVLPADNQALTSYAFMLGHANIETTSTGKTKQIDYTPAQAFTNYMALNIALKLKLFGDSY